MSLSALIALKALLDDAKTDGALDMTVLRTANRKPYFASLPLFFSLSHSDGLAAAALSDKNIGIDIEWLEQDRNILDISRRFFSPDEQKIIEESDDQALAFYSLWTKKEAYAKFTGEGLISVCSTASYDTCYFKQYLLEHQGKRAIISLCCPSNEEAFIHDPNKELTIYELQN